MFRLFAAWMINTLALFLLPHVFPWVQVDSMLAALVAALALGLVNVLIRPILFVLTLPATVLTLGLFIFVINGLLFWLVGSFVDGFRVTGFWSAMFGAIVYSVISWAIAALVMPAPRAPRLAPPGGGPR